MADTLHNDFNENVSELLSECVTQCFLKIKHIRPLVHNHVPTLKMKRQDRPSIGLKVVSFQSLLLLIHIKE